MPRIMSTNPDSEVSQGISRRRFFGTGALGTLAAGFGFRAAGVEALGRKGPARLRLSLAAYSFRDFFKDQPNGKEPKGAAIRPMDMPGFIDYCAAQGCDGAELTAYYFPKELTPELLLGLRRHAFLRGVSVSGSAVGNTFTLPAGPRREREVAAVKQWIEHARVLGAPHIRVFAGGLEGQTQAEARKNCIEALEECGEAAARAGVFLGIENHGGIVAEADELLAIVRAVKNPWVGINLDTGNFHSEDPYADLAKCAPYAVNVQVKVELRRKGAKAEATDLGRIVGLLRDSGYQGWVALEYESAEDPYLAVPRHLEALGRAMRQG